MPNQPIPLLELLVRKRDSLVYKGQAKAVSSVNLDGPFDVLPEHANFITIIKDRLVILKPDNTQEKFELKNGVLHSADNRVTIYLDILTQVAENVAGTPKNVTK